MSRLNKLCVVGMVAVAAPATAVAQKPPKPPKPGATTGLSLTAKPNPVVFGSATTLSGKLTGSNAGGRTVRVEADPAPYGDGFSNVTTATTANSGNYSVSVKPARNTHYRVTATGAGTPTSPVHRVSVRRRVGMRVSDSTPRRGQLVRFSGSIFPASVGKSVLVQRRSTTGRWVTIARTTAKAAGTDLSSYARRVRIHRTAVYRVKVVGDALFVNGISTVRKLTLS